MMQKKSAESQPPEGVETEAEPGSHRRVLRNKLGIQRKREMDRAEYDALPQARAEFVEELPPHTRFTTRLLC